MHWGRLGRVETMVAAAIVMLATAWVWDRARRERKGTPARWRGRLVVPAWLAVIVNLAFVVAMGVRPTRQLNASQAAWSAWSGIWLLLMIATAVAVVVSIAAAVVAAGAGRTRDARDWGVVLGANLVSAWPMLANFPDT